MRRSINSAALTNGFTTRYAAAALAVAACVGLGATSAMGATTRTWDGGGDGTTWSQATNWVGDVAPVTGDTAVFNATGAAHPNVNVGAAVSLEQLSVGTGYTLSGAAITLTQSDGGIKSIGTSTINNDLITGNPAWYQVMGTDIVTFGGDITASNNFKALNSTGTAVFNGSMSGAGRYYANGGDVTVKLYNTNTAAGGIYMDVTEATFELHHAGAITNAPITAGRGGFVDLVVQNALTGTGAVSASAALAQKVAAGVSIQEDQNYTGTTSITGTATWLGGPAITASLRVNNGHGSLGSATGSGNVTVTGGLLAGDGRIANAGTNGVTLSSNAAQGLLSPGATDGTVGTLAFVLGSKGLNISGAVAGTNSQALLFDLDTPAASDLVTLAGKLTLGSGKLEFDDFKFNLLSGFGAGTYTLFQTNTVITDTLGSNLSGTLDGKLSTLSLDGTGKNIILTVVPEPATLSLLAIGGLGLLARRRRA